jgi:hypothetical protein
MSPGAVRVGGVVSTTLTVKVSVEVLFDASRAVHETVVGPSTKVAPEGGEHDTVGAGSTASLALAEYETLAPPGPVASAVIGPGTTSAGGVVSTTVTVTMNVAVPVLPAPSVAEQVTVVGPGAKFEPEAGLQVTGGDPATRSVAEPGPYETVVPEGSPAVTVTGAGGVTIGGVVSTTVTVKEPAGSESDSMQFTVVSPSGKREPEGGLQVSPPASYETVAPPGPVASATMSSGTPLRRRPEANGAPQTKSSAQPITRPLFTIRTLWTPRQQDGNAGRGEQDDPEERQVGLVRHDVVRHPRGHARRRDGGNSEAQDGEAKREQHQGLPCAPGTGVRGRAANADHPGHASLRLADGDLLDGGFHFARRPRASPGLLARSRR